MPIWLIIVICFVGGFIISHFLVIYIVFAHFYRRQSLKSIERQLREDQPKEIFDFANEKKEELLKLPHEEIHISSFDGLRLVGDYYNFEKDKLIIFCHGLHSSPYISFSYTALNFIKKGYNVLIIDQRGSDRSGGKYQTYGKYESKDLLSWLEVFENDEKIKEIILYGISLGATSIMMASDQITSKKVKKLVLENGFTNHQALANWLISSRHVPGFMFMRSVTFLAKHLAKVSPEDVNTVEHIKNSKIPAVFIFNLKDKVVTKENFINNYDTCSVRKTLINIEDAPHAWSAIYEKDEFINKLFNALEEIG